MAHADGQKDINENTSVRPQAVGEKQIDPTVLEAFHCPLPIPHCPRIEIA